MHWFSERVSGEQHHLAFPEFVVQGTFIKLLLEVQSRKRV